MRRVFETDWLGSVPVFYNVKTGKASHNINDVIDLDNLEFDAQGLNNYLDFGYSVFEHTPVKHVRFLRHSSLLRANDGEGLTVEYLDDPVDKWLEQRYSEADVLDLLQRKVRNWEHSCNGEIIIPTSGGYDSRMLNLMIEDKSRIRSFSYGISQPQSASYEVVYARMLSQVLGTRWEQIELGEFHRYFDDWDTYFGVSTHAHGMYHIEFYTKMLPKVSGGNPFLSGIIGDAWAGSVEIPSVNAPADVNRLGYTHGMRADPAMSQLRCDPARLEMYFKTQKERLEDPRIRVIEAMRFKIILLSYLMTVPRSFGFEPWSPFLDVEVAMAMLRLPSQRRRNRLWQKEFFRKHDVDLESAHLNGSMQNNLNYQAMRKVPVRPLDSALLSEVIRPEYVEWINRWVGRPGSLWHWVWAFLGRPPIAGVAGRLGVRDQTLEAYLAYLTLKPIESLLLRRDAHRSNRRNDCATTYDRSLV